jgi:hypothetical protein
MANTLGNPTLVSNKAREGQVLSYNATLTSSPTAANPLLRIRKSTTNLVDFLLDPTTPFTGGSVDGAATFAFVAASAVAAGGVADIPDNYQVIGRDAAVHLSGVVSATDGISAGQTINASTITTTAPAS